MMEYIRWWAASNLSACSYSNDNEGLFGPGTCPVSCAWGYRQNFIFNLWERRKFEQPYAGSFRVWRMTVLTHCYPILCCCYGWVNQLLHNKCLPWASSLCSSRTHHVLFWIHPISSHSRCATFHFQRIKFLWVWPGFRERTLSNESPLQNDERLNTDWLLLVNIKIQFHPGWVDQILPLQTQWTTTTATRAAYHALLQTIDHGGDPSWSWERERERDRGEDSKWYSHFLGPAWLSSPAAGGFHILGKLHMLLHTWSGRKVVAEHSHIRHTVGLHSRLGPIGCQSLPGTANGRWTWINPKTVNTLSLHLFMKRIFPAKVIFNLKYDFTEIYMYIFLQCAPSLFRQVGGKTKLTIMDFLHLQYSKLRLA